MPIYFIYISSIICASNISSIVTVLLLLVWIGLLLFDFVAEGRHFLPVFLFVLPLFLSVKTSRNISCVTCSLSSHYLQFLLRILWLYELSDLIL